MSTTELFDGGSRLSTTEPTRPGPAAGRGRRRTRLLIAASAAWAVFVILLIVLTGRWGPWSLAEATPPLTLVAVPLLLLVAVPVLLLRPVRRPLGTARSRLPLGRGRTPLPLVPGRTLLALVAVQALLLLVGADLAGYGGAWAGPDDAATGTTGATGTTVKIFAWNTSFWQMTDDTDAFYAFLRRQNADVYLLQEYLYWTGDQPVRIDQSTRLRQEFPGYRVLVQGELLTLSRLPVVAAPDQSVPDTGTDWFWHGAKAQRTDILVGGQPVSFYNVHLPVPFRIEGSPLGRRFYQLLRGQQDWRADELRQLRQRVDADPYPTVLAGDFNSPWVQLYPPGAGSTAHSPAGGLLPARSWPVSTQFTLPRAWRLDWLFTRGDLTVTHYRFGAGGAFSDHASQEIRVVVPDRLHPTS